MAQLFDISNWNEQLWWSTGGTRNKKVYLNPEDGEIYYFKESYKKGKRDYKYEFWSEIIASEIGISLEFNVLEYHIALRGNDIGCISKSMINSESEELVEGGKYLQAFDNTFKPENIKERGKYTFDLILETLVSFKKEKHLKDLVETIVFDALIGNSDRHQENWAIINVHTFISSGITKIENDIKKGDIDKMPNWLLKIINKVYTVKGKIRPEIGKVRLMLPQQTRFAPIYDSGCSFGRELDNEKILQMLNNELEIEKYIAKGLSEIHWKENKISHFELIKKLINQKGLRNYALDSLQRTVEKFDAEKILKILKNIDIQLIDANNNHYLPKERKEYIFKLLTLRINKLREIYFQNK